MTVGLGLREIIVNTTFLFFLLSFFFFYFVTLKCHLGCFAKLNCSPGESLHFNFFLRFSGMVQIKLKNLILQWPYWQLVVSGSLPQGTMSRNWSPNLSFSHKPSCCKCSCRDRVQISQDSKRQRSDIQTEPSDGQTMAPFILPVDIIKGKNSCKTAVTCENRSCCWHAIFNIIRVFMVFMAFSSFNISMSASREAFLSSL